MEFSRIRGEKGLRWLVPRPLLWLYARSSRIEKYIRSMFWAPRQKFLATSLILVGVRGAHKMGDAEQRRANQRWLEFWTSYITSSYFRKAWAALELSLIHI